MHRGLALLAAGSLFGCSEPRAQNASDELQRLHRRLGCTAPLSRPAKDTLKICGLLTPGFDRTFIEALDDTVKRVEITSPGGYTPAALAIAQAIQKRRLTVVADQLCESACAYLVLIGAEEVVIKDGTLVSFHHTSSYVHDIAAQWPETREASGADAVPAGEKKLYVDRGLDVSMLYKPGLAVGPVCVRPVRFRGALTASVQSYSAVYVPRRSELVLFGGGKWQGYWPASAEEADRLSERLFPSRKGKLVFGMPRVVQTAPVSERLPMIKPCPK